MAVENRKINFVYVTILILGVLFSESCCCSRKGEIYVDLDTTETVFFQKEGKKMVFRTSKGEVDTGVFQIPVTRYFKSTIGFNPCENKNYQIKVQSIKYINNTIKDSLRIDSIKYVVYPGNSIFIEGFYIDDFRISKSDFEYGKTITYQNIIFNNLYDKPLNSNDFNDQYSLQNKVYVAEMLYSKKEGPLEYIIYINGELIKINRLL